MITDFFRICSKRRRWIDGFFNPDFLYNIPGANFTIIPDVPHYGRGIRYRCKYPWAPGAPRLLNIRSPVFDKLLAWTRIISIASLRCLVYPLQQRLLKRGTKPCLVIIFNEIKIQNVLYKFFSYRFRAGETSEWYCSLWKSSDCPVIDWRMKNYQ